jgi:flagellar biosynthesis GTPase FlhF
VGLLISAILIILLSCAALLYFGRPFSRINSENDLDTASIIRKIKPSIVTIRVGNLGTGSGFVVDKEGYIITNAHVMREKTATAAFSDGFETEVNLVMLDEERDFALVKTAISKEYEFLTLGDSTKCSEGDTVIAAGTPLGLEFSFTKGIISSTKRSLPFLQAHLIQTDAAINPGNSGGPLVNTQGGVVGINFSHLAGLKMPVEGIGFAIAINDIKAHIEKKRQMSDAELTQAMAREMKKLEEISQTSPTDEIKKMKERAIEEQWEAERRRRELNEKIEAANRDLQEQKQKIEQRLQEEADQGRKRSQEVVEARSKALTECLQGATNQYQWNWNDYCKKYNEQESCSLPYNIASLLEQRLGQMRNECYRMNPQ